MSKPKPGDPKSPPKKSDRLDLIKAPSFDIDYPFPIADIGAVPEDPQARLEFCEQIISTHNDLNAIHSGSTIAQGMALLYIDRHCLWKLRKTGTGDNERPMTRNIYFQFAAQLGKHGSSAATLSRSYRAAEIYQYLIERGRTVPLHRAVLHPFFRVPISQVPTLWDRLWTVTAGMPTEAKSEEIVAEFLGEKYVPKENSAQKLKRIISVTLSKIEAAIREGNSKDALVLIDEARDTIDVKLVSPKCSPRTKNKEHPPVEAPREDPPVGSGTPPTPAKTTESGAAPTPETSESAEPRDKSDAAGKPDSNSETSPGTSDPKSTPETDEPAPAPLTRVFGATVVILDGTTIRARHLRFEGGKPPLSDVILRGAGLTWDRSTKHLSLCLPTNDPSEAMHLYADLCRRIADVQPESAPPSV